MGLKKLVEKYQQKQYSKELGKLKEVMKKNSEIMGRINNSLENYNIKCDELLETNYFKKLSKEFIEEEILNKYKD